MDPKALKYATSHEWVAIEGDLATVGISKFAVEQLTDLIMIDLGKAKPGATLAAGETLGEVESVKAVSDIYAPLSGEVVEVNPAVADDVSVLADDPFGKGWLVKIRPSNADAELAKLMDHEAYQKRIAEEAH